MRELSPHHAKLVGTFFQRNEGEEAVNSLNMRISAGAHCIACPGKA